jgi:hypothetical protein
MIGRASDNRMDKYMGWERNMGERREGGKI